MDFKEPQPYLQWGILGGYVLIGGGLITSYATGMVGGSGDLSQLGPLVVLFALGLVAGVILIKFQRRSIPSTPRPSREDETSPAEREAWIRARHDTVTGLSNRWWFFEQVQDHLETIENGKERAGFVLGIVDLVGLNTINDYYGHQVGNRLLENSARWLQKKLERSDLQDVLLGHLGSDEFGIMIPYRGPAPSKTLLRDVLEPLRYTFQLTEVEITQSFNAGLAIYPEDGDSLKQVMSAAGRALDRGKEDPRRTLTFFQASDRKLLEKQMASERFIKEALKQQMFQMYYQPIVDADDGAVILQEALLRVETDGAENRAPSELESILEQPKLSRTLDRWVLTQVIDETRSYLGEDGFPRVAVNLLPASLMDWSFIKEIDQTLIDANVPKEKIVFEISEKVLLSDARRVFRNIRQADQLGLRFALDDFGVGFGSFKTLKSIPLELLKIDGSFVKELKESPVDQKFIETLAILGNQLKLPVVAEWIESEPTADLLNELGIHYHQGFFHGKPEPLGQIVS